MGNPIVLDIEENPSANDAIMITTPNPLEFRPLDKSLVWTQDEQIRVVF